METLLHAGRFEVRGTLGAGSAGTVYRAFDRQLQREVALKLLRQASGRDLYRFKREFRSLADIVHPNLVALHEMHASGGDWYFTMELVEGVSFIDWVRPGKQTGPLRARADIAEAPLDVVRLRGALVQLVDALLALHRAGKLHRDLKPSNVLVTRTGRVALLDFGLVVGLAEGNPDRLAVGTPVYMSPEQASDQPLDEASDWYSVGAMLYEALTARRPFEGESEEVMTRKQTEQPRRPQQVATGIPDALAELSMLLLSSRPAERPSGAELLDALGAAPSPTTRGISRGFPAQAFIGRTGEIAMLRTALADVRRGGVTVLVKGKSGIGKSTLVRRFLREVGDGVFVVEGRCFERESVPFKMLDGVVDSLTAVVLRLLPAEIDAIAPRDLGSLVRMFPVLRRVPRFAELAGKSPVPVDPQELRRRGFRALKSTFAKLARLRPLVIFVDDAHWGDVDSTGFLADLLHGSELGVLVIVAHRPEDYLGIVAQLKRPPGGNARRGDVRDLEITGLSDDDAALLVTQLAQDSHDAARTDAALAAGGGNPLVLTEMARAESFARGMKLEDVVREKMSRLPPDVQSLLAVSSIAARPLPVEIAAHAAGVIGGLDESAQLVAERLATLREVDGATILHPAHDYVRAAVLASLDTETKAGWHEALAQAFEAVQGEDKLDQQAVVEHWLAAGFPANAAHHAVGAALQAEEHLAFRRAAELYQLSLTFGPWDAAGQRDLLRRKAHALVCAGQLDEAAEVFAHAAQLLVDDDSIDLERLRVEALLRRGRLDEALPAAEQLLKHIGIRMQLNASARAKLATQWRAFAIKLRGLDYVERDVAEIPPADLLVIDVLYSITSGLAFADPALGRVVLAELMRAALDAGEPVRVCLALAQEVCYAAAAGSRNRIVVEAVGRRLLAIAGRLAHRELSGFADVAIGIAAFQSGRWRDARGHLESGLQTLRDHGAGVRWEIDIGDTFWLSSLLYLGEWAEMARMTQMLLRDAIDRADLVAQQNLRSGRCTYAWLLLDRADEARAQLDIAERTLREGFHLPHVAAVSAAANIALYRQDASTAAKCLDDAWPAIEKLGCLRMQQLRVELVALRARIALADASRDVDDRARFVRDAADDLLKEGTSWAAGLGHMLRAGVYALTDTPAAARVELLAAEEQLVTAGMMGFVHVVRLRRGRIEGGAVGTARAEAARDFLKDLGAVQPDAMAWHLLPWPS